MVPLVAIESESWTVVDDCLVCPKDGTYDVEYSADNYSLIQLNGDRVDKSVSTGRKRFVIRLKKDDQLALCVSTNTILSNIDLIVTEL